jgi:hypothetical protein
MQSLSVMKSNLDSDGRMIDTKRSNTGHQYIDVNGSVSIFIMMNLFLLIFAGIYLAFRVYFSKKYLTPKKGDVSARREKYLENGQKVEEVNQNSQ